MTKELKICRNCNKVKPVTEFAARRLVCKQCFNIQQKAARAHSYELQSIQLFQEYESHPLISPLLYPNNKHYHTLGLGCEHRHHPHWFVLFHLLTHHQLESAIHTFHKMYGWQYTERFNANYDSQSRHLAEFFNPSLYSKEQMIRELYESNHHCFPTQPGHAYYRHRRNRIMVKTHRMFFKKRCHTCGQIKPTYHVNYSQKPNWLQYLLDTIFNFKECYPLPINYVPILSYKDGWTGTCNICRKLPLDENSWQSYELEQGYTNRGRYLTVIREAMLKAPSYQPHKERNEFGIILQKPSGIGAIPQIDTTTLSIPGSGEVLNSSLEQQIPEKEPVDPVLKGILYY